MDNLMVEIDESVFGEDLFNSEVLGELSEVLGDDAKGAAEAAMAEAQRAASTGAPARASRGRRKRCPVVSCPACSAELCVVCASPRAAGDALPSWDSPPPAPQAPLKSVPKTRVVGAVAAIARKKAAAGEPAQVTQPPRALVCTGASFFGTCPSCGTDLDLTVAATAGARSPAAPMTVRQIVGDDGDALGDLLEELVGDVPKAPPRQSPPKPAPPKPASAADEQPAWQKYLNLANQFLPTAVSAIAEAAKPSGTDKAAEANPPPSEPPPSSTASFFTQEIGPLPAWGWGAAVLVLGGGGFLYWKKSKKTT